MSDRFRDRDLKITADGDLALDVDNDIDIVYNLDYVEQTVLSRLKSSSEDWFYDKIGANIEWAVGKVNNSVTAKTLVDNIITALTVDGFCVLDDLLVRATPIDPITLAVFIFIKTEFDYDPIGYKITLDYLAGLEIQKL